MQIAASSSQFYSPTCEVGTALAVLSYLKGGRKWHERTCVLLIPIHTGHHLFSLTATFMYVTTSSFVTLQSKRSLRELDSTNLSYTTLLCYVQHKVTDLRNMIVKAFSLCGEEESHSNVTKSELTGCAADAR